MTSTEQVERVARAICWAMSEETDDCTSTCMNARRCMAKEVQDCFLRDARVAIAAVGEEWRTEPIEVELVFALEAADELDAKARHAEGILSAIPAIVADERIEQHNAVWEAEAKRWKRLANAVRALATTQARPLPKAPDVTEKEKGE